MRPSLPIIGWTSVAILSSLFTTSFARPAVQDISSSVPDLSSSVQELIESTGYDDWLLSKIEKDPGAPFADVIGESYVPHHLRHGRRHFHGHNKHAAPAITVEDPTPVATPVVGRRDVSSSSAVGFVAPAVVTSTLLGPAVNNPSKMYFAGQRSEALPALPTDLLSIDLTVIPPLADDYPQYNGSGAITLSGDNSGTLQPLSTVPWISRDAGRGGNLGGTKMFIFSDSETFTEPPNETATGWFTGFVSNSVACDLGFAAADGQAPVIRDKVGIWSNNNGGMRGWIPWTTGEKQYNNKMLGHGGRIAIWPSSAITLLTADTALQYASIVFINTTNGANFHFVGTTMYTITVPNTRSGPVANRTAPLLFPRGGLEWGSTGGTRSWGAEGPGGSDGWVWAWANSGAGLWAARAPADSVADINSYTYYWASTGEWNSTAPPPGTGTSDVTISGSYSASDIFYSPRHKTFINVYADRYIDNQILWRYLVVPEPIEPTYDGTDFNLAMVNYPWSRTQTLFHCPVPGNGHYVYSQGTSPGYFDDDDIINGGDLMLLTWTAPTGQGSDTYVTQYQLMTAVVTWS